MLVLGLGCLAAVVVPIRNGQVDIVIADMSPNFLRARGDLCSGTVPRRQLLGRNIVVDLMDGASSPALSLHLTLEQEVFLESVGN